MHWPQFWCKNYVRFAFIFHLFCWEFMISYILVSSTISVSEWCSFRSSQMRRSHWNRSYLFFRRTRVYPLFYGESCSLFSIFGQFCWPVFYGECCSVFSIFGQFLLTNVFAYFLLAIVLSCLSWICGFWLLLRYLQNFPVN